MPETVLQALPVLDLDDPRGADPLRRHIRQLVEAVAEHGRRRKRIDQLEGGGTMAKTDFKSVDQYIASQPAAARAPLGRVRNAIRKAVPGAEEVISYQIPAYKMRGDPVLFFAGWQRHYSLYPATARVVAALKDELAPFEVSKGTIRFRLSRPVPTKLIRRIAKLRATEVAERAQAKAVTAKGRDNARVRPG